MTEAPASVEFVVDAARRIRESSAAELRVGDVLTPALWLGQASLDAIDAAAVGGDPVRVGRDLARGTHWVLRATVAQREPWRARVVAFDATRAVMADRDAVFAKLAHALTNVGFALTSVLDVLHRDRPTGAQLDECLAYLREPATRLSTAMSRLVGCTVRPRLSLEPTSVERLIDRGLSRTADARRPRRVSVARGLRVSCDAGALSETIAAMLEGGVVGQARALEARSAEVDGRPHARIAVEGRAHVKLGPDALAATWELHGGHQLEPQLRLSFGRDVVLAHGGRVFAEPAATDGVELGLLLPIHGAG